MNIIIVFSKARVPLTINLRGWRSVALLLAIGAAAYFSIYTVALNMAEQWAQNSDPRIVGMLEKIRQRTDLQRIELWNSTVDRLDQQATNLRTRIWRISHLGNEIAERMGFSEEILIDPGTLPSQDPVLLPDADPDERIGALEAKFFEIDSLLETESDRLTQIGNSVAEVAMQRSTIPKKIPIIGNFYRSSGYGKRRDPFTGRSAFHAGYDYAARTGTPIVAAADGIVTHRGRLGNYGKLIEIYHGNDVSTLYGHLSDYRIELGDFVSRDQIIGLVGSTGRSTGPHLHYEVRYKGRPSPYTKLTKQLLKERPIVALRPPLDIQ